MLILSFARLKLHGLRMLEKNYRLLPNQLLYCILLQHQWSDHQKPPVHTLDGFVGFSFGGLRGSIHRKHIFFTDSDPNFPLSFYAKLNTQFLIKFIFLVSPRFGDKSCISGLQNQPRMPPFWIMSVFNEVSFPRENKHAKPSRS